MNAVGDILTQYLPSKRKVTPSGWISFSAPCCIHNGERADTKQRGGLKQEGDTVSYHCFNCNFKTSWQPGRPLSIKMRKLMEWLNVPTATVNKLSLDVLRLNEGVAVEATPIAIPSFETVALPDYSVRIRDIPDYNKHNPSFENFLGVIEYMFSRNLNLDDTDYYWTSAAGYRDRLIIPFYYQGKTVGWTARSCIKDRKPKYLSQSQPGYVYNLDEQRPQKAFCIVVEGAIDAIHVDGVAVLRNEINEQQAALINSLNKDVIVVPDRDRAGSKLIEQAIEQGWSVSMPDWKPGIKDVSDAVAEYGRLYTLYSIVNSAESSLLKIKLRKKKWIG
jgi:5S rRNA maturation endonuclease (ribonuclease M5)